MNHAYIFLAEGFEEIEALATLDVLRRAGIYAKTVSISDSFQVCGSHGIQVEADTVFNLFCVEEEELDESDILIFPGGMPGSKNLAEDGELISVMQEHAAAGGLVAAICAAPGLVLSQLGKDYLDGRIFTCYDGCEDGMLAQGAILKKEPAVCDGRMITGRGPAFALDFALEIVKAMRGEEIWKKVKSGLLL